MSNMFGGDQLDKDYVPHARKNYDKPDAVSPYGPIKTHVRVENMKLHINDNSLEISGEHHYYNDAGKEIQSHTPAKILKLNFTTNPHTEMVCFQLSKEALRDIVDRLNGFPVYYSYDQAPN